MLFFSLFLVGKKNRTFKYVGKMSKDFRLAFFKAPKK